MEADISVYKAAKLWSDKQGESRCYVVIDSEGSQVFLDTFDDLAALVSDHIISCEEETQYDDQSRYLCNIQYKGDVATILYHEKERSGYTGFVFYRLGHLSRKEQERLEEKVLKNLRTSPMPDRQTEA